MSDEIKKDLEGAKSWIIRGSVSVAVFFALAIFNDIRNDVKSIGHDIQTMKEKFIHLDDKIDRHDEDIKELKAKNK